MELLFIQRIFIFIHSKIALFELLTKKNMMRKKKIENLRKVVINETVFFKTILSDKGKYCVGVSVNDNVVRVINTKEKQTIVTFSKEEWSIFLSGVKAGHFDNL